MGHTGLHVFTAIIIIFAAGFLIVCPKYKDGVVGRFGLGAMCFSAGMILLRWFEGYPFIPSASEIATNIGVCIFLGWHCFRFARRILAEKRIGFTRRASDEK